MKKIFFTLCFIGVSWAEVIGLSGSISVGNSNFRIHSDYYSPVRTCYNYYGRTYCDVTYQRYVPPHRIHKRGYMPPPPPPHRYKNAKPRRR